MLYEINIYLGKTDPETFLRTVLYVIGLNVALRGGEEHRSLRHGSNSQLSVATLPWGNALQSGSWQVSSGRSEGLWPKYNTAVGDPTRWTSSNI